MEMINRLCESSIVISLYGIIKQVSPSLEELLGYDKDELLGKNIDTIIPEPYKHKHDNYIKKYRRGGKEKFVNSIRTVVVVLKNGSYLPAELSISRISEDRIVGIFRKISLIDMLYDGIIGMYMKNVIMANDIVADIFNCKLNDMIGNKITKYISRKDLRNGSIDIMDKNDNNSKTYKLSKIELDNEMYFILITEMKEMNLIRKEKKKIETLNRELKEKINENEKLLKVKTDFLANMSHEIRTPMNGIYGMLSLLKDTNLNSVQNDYLNVCRRSAESLMAVLDDVLLISKSGSGNIELENISFNLSELIEDVINITSHGIDADKNIDLVYFIDPRIPRNIIGDPTRLRQILNNLVGNAVKFTHLGEVALEVSLVEKDPFKIQFEVNDTGIGMTSEEIDRIFKPFVQADSSTTRNYGGTGLGLVICKQLVELFNGELNVRSRAGRGSTFTFTIEALPDEYCDECDEDTSDILANKRILVVDDNAVNCLLMDQILNNCGCISKSVRSGLKAIDDIHVSIIDDKPYDIVILDYHMPSLNGIEVANIIKEKGFDKYFEMLMISSYNAMPEARKSSCIKYFMNKPVKKQILISTLENIIKSKQNNNISSNSEVIEEEAHIPIISNSEVIEEGAHIPIVNNSAAMEKVCLIVEDNLINQQVLSLLLKKMNFEILIANNGLGALEMLDNAKNITVIMMDIHMPRMDGLQATKIIRTKGIDIPIIAITADISFNTNTDYKETGFNGCLNKPVFENSLIKELNRVLKIDL